MTPQEFLEQHYAAPDLQVIAAAIELVRSGRQVFSCTALSLEVYAAAPQGYYHAEGGTDAVYHVAALYREQYRLSAQLPDGSLPDFWDGDGTAANCAARIRALENFRAACIAAANKEQA